MKTVCVVAGTDPLHGAGVVLDTLVLRELGLQALSVPMAWVAQNSRGVHGWRPVPRPAVEAMLASVAEDVAPDAIKVGMTGGARRLRWMLQRARSHWPDTPIVVDPVMASGGPRTTALSPAEAATAWCAALSGVALVTPNVQELARLLDAAPAEDERALREQARALAARTGAGILAKGGHLLEPGTDVLVLGNEVTVLPPHPWAWDDIHGTGCCLSSLIAGYIATGSSLPLAVEAARATLAGWCREPHRVARVGRGRPQFVFAGVR